MKTKVKYFIAHYGAGSAHAWDADGARWVPHGMKLYITFWDNINDVFRECSKVRRACSGWHDDIYIDSELTVA